MERQYWGEGVGDDCMLYIIDHSYGHYEWYTKHFDARLAKL